MKKIALAILVTVNLIAAKVPFPHYGKDYYEVFNKSEAKNISLSESEYHMLPNTDPNGDNPDPNKFLSKYDACKDQFDMILQSLNGFKGFFIAIYSTKDRCDGGNALGAVYYIEGVKKEDITVSLVFEKAAHIADISAGYLTKP